MMRHVGDARLGPAPFSDVRDRDEVAIMAVEGHPPSEGENLDLAAISFEMPPVAAGEICIAELVQRLGVADPFVFRLDVTQLHCVEDLVNAIKVPDSPVGLSGASHS